MKRHLLTLVLVMSLMMVLAAPLAVSAQNLLEGKDATQVLKDTGTVAYGTADAPQLLPMIGNIIKILLTLLGVIFLILVVYAGFMWMTAGGDKEKVEKAQDILKRAVIGLAITLAAYAISDFVISNINAVIEK
ncbi:hypothetical protein HZB94_04660 [Candidatus Falkowbacteria bacterium]|nr:hypothetical protein [Candidatus Falkowbacteria bacterium]